jgi:RNA polymerase-binding transcription factor DksA
MDTFFSGSSDVVPPEGGSRRSPPVAERSETDLEAEAPYFCERCDESIPLSELAAGRARLVYGLPFCPRCAPLLEEERYQIYFCDRCGVSIPLERVEAGEALAGDGHVLCVRCRRRSPRVARWAGLTTAGLGVVLLLVLLVPGWRTVAPEATGPAPRTFGAELDAARQRLEGRLDELGAERSGSAARTGALLTELEAQARKLDELDDRLERLVPRESPHLTQPAGR